MVLATHGKNHRKTRFEKLGHRRKEVYHRLDLRGSDKTKYCKLFDEILTKGKTADMKLLEYNRRLSTKYIILLFVKTIRKNNNQLFSHFKIVSDDYAKYRT